MANSIFPFLQGWIFLEFLFVYFMYVETMGPTLEELAKIIDGDDAKVAHLDLRQVEKEGHLASASNEELVETKQ